MMSKLRCTTREIGSVRVFDLQGEPNQETLQEIVWKIQRSIRRHRLQRVILNVQKIKSLDELGIRKLIAAFLRPRKSAIYGASELLQHQFEDTYLPGSIKICPTEKEVAEDLGPFLLQRDEIGHVLGEKDHLDDGPRVGKELERRRSKRMHVAIPLELTFHPSGKEPFVTRGISTNISEGGIFVEYLDLDALEKVEALNPIEGTTLDIQILPSSNFPESYQLQGVVRRRDLRRGGLGLAIEFIGSFGPSN